MYKGILAGVLVFAGTSLFGMSLVELNSATKAELMEIKGIGEAKATDIIKEREKGEFKSFEDFQRVKGVGEKMALKVKNSTKSTSSTQKTL